MVFVDTSALCPLLSANDEDHQRVAPAWQGLRTADARLLTTNYVLLETAAVVQNRLGLSAVAALRDGIVPVLAVEWVTPELHEAATEALFAANRRDLSLVDCVSFAIMRRLGVRQVFTLDAHFREQGFDCVP
jgi:predicted nucleic acid-binding protein